MGLTYEQAKSLGIERYHPDHPDAPPRGRTLLDIVGDDGPIHPTYAPRDMTKLERRFRDEILDAALASRHLIGYWREPIKLRLGGHTFYQPDFLVSEWMGDHGLPPRLTFVEVKGYMRDDAAVKLKVAAKMFGVFGWLLVTRPNKAWEVRQVTATGIGRDLVRVPWIKEWT